jgi:transposase
MTSPTDLTHLSPSEKDALITALLAQVQAQAEQIALLTARVADLEARLNLPPKNPSNSSTPPSQGRKANGEGKSKPKGKAHAGTHRPLHPNPTRRCDRLADQCPHCHADVTGVAQVAVQSYDRIEIPEITPEVTRVTLHGGVCPCCARRFKAPPPAGLEPG